MPPAYNLLIVEDDEYVLGAVRLMALKLGHRLLAARDGEEAMIYMNTWSKYIQSILLDWRLPSQLFGRTLIDAMRRCDPHCRIVVMSGLPEAVVRPQLPVDEQVLFLPKPFFVHELEGAIRTSHPRTFEK